MPQINYQARKLKAPAGLPSEAGIEFIEAVNEAAALGYTVWHLTEQWNGTWYCSLAAPNCNASELGESMSYGRQGATPGAAIRAVIAQFGATPAEKEAKELRKELLESAILEAIHYMKAEDASAFNAAWAANVAARQAFALAAVPVEDDEL